MTRAGVRIGMLVALTVGAAPQAAGQSPPPPCSAGVADQPTLSAIDKDESGGSTLVATHTIQASADFGSPPPFQQEDDSTVVLSAPAGVSTIPRLSGNGVLTFFSQAAGSVPITVTWTQDDGTGNGTCTGSTTVPLQLQPAAPTPRFKNLRALEHLHPNLKFDLTWVFTASLGPRTDLDPVQVMARGVAHARLPGSKVPFKTVMVPLRSGDPGFSETKQYRISLTRWTIEANGDHSTIGVQGRSHVSSFRDRPLGYEVKVLQDGRLLLHLRLAGACNATICKMRTVKVQASAAAAGTRP